MAHALLSRCLITLTLAAITLNLQFSISADAATHTRKVARVVVLKHTTPGSLMLQLGLVPDVDGQSGDDTVWRRTAVPTQGPKTASPVPEGIDMLAPYAPDNAVLVYGEKGSVDGFLQTMSRLDVAPDMVQVKAEVYALNADKASKLGIDWALDSGADNSQVSLVSPVVLKALRESVGQPVAAPIIHTCNNVAAEIHLSSDQHDTKISVLPRVNRDKTITLSIDWSMRFPGSSEANEPVPVRTQSLRSNRRMADGESIIVSGIGSPTSGAQFLVLTATLDKSGHAK